MSFVPMKHWCIGVSAGFQLWIWMLERERSGNAPPTKPQLSSWILNPLMKSDLCPAAQRLLSCQHSYVGYSGAYCMLHKVSNHNLSNIKQEYYRYTEPSDNRWNQLALSRNHFIFFWWQYYKRLVCPVKSNHNSAKCLKADVDIWKYKRSPVNI